MTVFVEIHALQTVPPSNINRDDSGTPKTALYGGVTRSRVSSQSWKKAIRDDFNATLDPKDVGTRSRLLASWIQDVIIARRPDLEESAQTLAVSALEAVGFKLATKTRGKAAEGTPETGYLVFMSQRQIETLAEAAIEASSEEKPREAMKARKIKNLIDTDHSIDIALFGRMVADSSDLNVDAACQVAHALSVHEASPEYDFYTAVDDAKQRDTEAEDAGAGMMGTVGFVSSTLYRYAAVNVDQLRHNLGNEDALRLALEAFIRSFVRSMPTGKQNTFANNTWPSAVLVTVATGQPTSLVGAFEDPIHSDAGFVRPAAKKLAKYAQDVFETWRSPQAVFVTGLPDEVEVLSPLGESLSFEDLPARTAAVAMGEE